MATIWKSICVTGLAFWVIYYLIISTDSGYALTQSWSWQSPSSPERSDLFALRPEQHIFRRPHTISLQWNITREPRRPDGVLKETYLINGQFPGPTVEARSGDELHITVYNGITGSNDGVAIHWHGITMKGFNEMDGAVGITQCAVGPGRTFVYRFQIGQQQHGTFWYHAHSAVQRADGMYGGLVVHKPVGKQRKSELSVHGYDSEKLLLIGDWYHRSADRVLAEYKDFRSFANEPVPDSLLINGAGSYNCSNARPGKPVDCTETDTPVVHVHRTRVRLRIVNTGASAGYSLQLTGAAMKLVTLDGGGLVSKRTPWTSTIGVLYPGERMDVVLLPSGEQTTKALKIALDPELMQLMNPALTRMQEFPLKWTQPDSRSSRARGDRRELVNVVNLRDAQGVSTALDKMATEKALLYTSLAINSFKNNEPWGELNHTSWMWKDPYAKPLLAINATAWQNGTEQANPFRAFKVPRFEAGEERWMDLVVNNVDDRGHPFHLHGYEFYVLASRQDELGRAYNPFDDHGAEIPVNIQNPLRKDTVYIKPRGYVVLRLRLNASGLWLMHCHVLWHQAAGMGTVLQVGDISEETVRKAGDSCQGY
ncbi:hypothetical protein E4U57_000704 [Claviceps arundinis]|uniref:Multicopper oxidase n=1 Tax=Claviceps arundinis TaxID=1623583 RepID=A0A9P7MYM6_9HYPO|nr:hypothetical protein E4U57_000704 [Claviceps arundinis]KAG5974039.1 hypothetical protein E4U56_005023 [Claviceps arundinis]